jgi:hypothetical protein
LYSVQCAWKALGHHHFFGDVNEIRMRDGTRIPFGSTHDGFPLEVIYGPPRSDAIVHKPREASAAFATSLPGGLALVWRRFGYPYNAQWQQSLAATEGAFPSAVVSHGKLPAVDRFLEPAILRGRMNALPLFTNVRASPGKPGDKVYMDGCGPVVASVVQRYTNYMGCVCAASGYARSIPCHKQDAAAAVAALATFIADLRSRLGEQRYLAPLVVRTDGGGAFILENFEEFCQKQQSQLTVSPPYVPQANSFAELLRLVRFRHCLGSALCLSSTGAL